MLFYDIVTAIAAAGAAVAAPNCILRHLTSTKVAPALSRGGGEYDKQHRSVLTINVMDDNYFQHKCGKL